jgi:hypothetical protein
MLKVELMAALLDACIVQRAQEAMLLGLGV